MSYDKKLLIRFTWNQKDVPYYAILQIVDKGILTTTVTGSVKTSHSINVQKFDSKILATHHQQHIETAICKNFKMLYQRDIQKLFQCFINKDN